VDLYGRAGRLQLEDVQSFRKYVGGSATNIAVGTARLGGKERHAHPRRDEQMGRFVRKTLAENGVTSARSARPGEAHPYVLLAVRAIEDFPRIFAYGDAADLAVRRTT
jgi:5-dehydro-2-deoxygluconokinase